MLGNWLRADDVRRFMFERTTNRIGYYESREKDDSVVHWLPAGHDFVLCGVFGRGIADYLEGKNRPLETLGDFSQPLQNQWGYRASKCSTCWLLASRIEREETARQLLRVRAIPFAMQELEP